jgi:pimeloyl-ACP methyl ester carboxylesterase
MIGTLVAGIVLLAAMLVGWTWQRGAKAKAELAAKYPPPGKMMGVGGYRLHLNCQGQGSPTVVIEAGNADCSLSWGPVQCEVAKFTRTCTYDRAGLGWSERSLQPRTAHNLVEDLHTVLARSGVEPPYVLVGHSLGGLLVRLYAHEHPDQVVGMVLVDAAHEEQLLRYPEAVRRAQPRTDKMMAWILRLAQMFAAAGAFALVPKLYPRQYLVMAPEEARETYLGVISADAKCLEAIREEYGVYQNHFTAVRAAHLTTVGDIPLIVLSHGQTQKLPGLSEEISREVEQTWQQMQVELAAQSSNGKRIVAEESGHFIQLDQPELVIDSIHQVVDAARHL